MVLQVLVQGGIDLAKISKMAWEELKGAIPIALGAILVEKLVSMIVPAAGAVIAIIEGLQAAWGTLQRIVAAMGAFIAFLKAVKTAAPAPNSPKCWPWPPSSSSTSSPTGSYANSAKPQPQSATS